MRRCVNSVAVTWPDVVIGAAVILGALFGWKRGLLGELIGFFALAFAITAGVSYAGVWDGWLQRTMHWSPSGAHIAGIVLYALAAYAIARVLGMALGTVTRLPVIGTANAALGAVLGAAKAAVIVWALLYVVLFFPLPYEMRADLHRSRVVALLVTPNAGLDDRLRTTLPWFVRPYADQLFDQHHV